MAKERLADPAPQRHADLLRSVRAIAHPLRIQIYELLVLDGPMTVSTVADRCSIAVGSASYHLMQLAEAGYAEEADPSPASDRRDRRERWWRAGGHGLEWNPADMLDSPGARDLSSSATAMLVQRRALKLMTWARGWSEWPRAWIEAAQDIDTYLDLAPDELRELASELDDVVSKWRKRTTGDGARRADRERVFLAYSAFPTRREGHTDE